MQADEEIVVDDELLDCQSILILLPLLSEALLNSISEMVAQSIGVKNFLLNHFSS